MTTFIWISALLAVLSAFEMEGNKTWNENMNCGQCIKNGYNFCFQGFDGMVMSLNSHNVPHTCCEDETCAEASDSSYSCSHTYSDTNYALSMCPPETG